MRKIKKPVHALKCLRPITSRAGKKARHGMKLMRQRAPQLCDSSEQDMPLRCGAIVLSMDLVS